MEKRRGVPDQRLFSEKASGISEEGSTSFPVPEKK